MKKIENTVIKDSRLLNILKRYSLLIIILVLIVIFSLLADNFLTLSNISSMLIVQITTGCISIGALLILIIGEFDLSFGYLIGFCMMLGAVLAQNGVPGVVIIIAVLAAGCFAGFLNGLITVKAKVSSFVSTLAIGIILSGLTQGLSNGEVISSNIPKFLIDLGQSKTFGMGNCVWLFLIIAAIMYVVLEHTTFGRNLYAIGGSEKVSFMAGIKTNKVKMMVFILGGFFTALAAIIQLGQSGAAFPAYGSNLLMPSYAAAFLSITAYKPGNYNMMGLIFSIVVIGVGINGLNIIGAPFWAENIYNGCMLILSILIARNDAKRIRVGS